MSLNHPELEFTDIDEKLLEEDLANEQKLILLQREIQKYKEHLARSICYSAPYLTHLPQNEKVLAFYNEQEPLFYLGREAYSSLSVLAKAAYEEKLPTNPEYKKLPSIVIDGLKKYHAMNMLQKTLETDNDNQSKLHNFTPLFTQVKPLIEERRGLKALTFLKKIVSILTGGRLWQTDGEKLSSNINRLLQGERKDEEIGKHSQSVIRHLGLKK